MENTTFKSNAFENSTVAITLPKFSVLTPQLVSENTVSTEHFGVRLNPTQFLKFDHDTNQPFFEIPLLSALKHKHIQNLSYSINCPTDLKYSHITYSLDNLWNGHTKTIILNQPDKVVFETALGTVIDNYDFILLSGMISPSFSLRIHNIRELLQHLGSFEIILNGNYINFSDTLETDLSDPDNCIEQVVRHNGRYNVCRHMHGLVGMAYSTFLTSQEFSARHPPTKPRPAEIIQKTIFS